MNECMSDCLFQAVSVRWPSWAPKDEFYGAGKLAYLTQYMPQTGFSTAFK